MVSKVRNFWLCVFSGVVATTLIDSAHIEIATLSSNNRVRNYWGRVTNLPLLLAEEGSQITTFGGRRVTNHNKLAGEGSQMKI